MILRVEFPARIDERLREAEHHRRIVRPGSGGEVEVGIWEEGGEGGKGAAAVEFDGRAEGVACCEAVEGAAEAGGEGGGWGGGRGGGGRGGHDDDDVEG